MKIFQPKNLQYLFIAAFAFFFMESCKPKGTQSAATGDASKAYVAPGKYDEFYNFVSGGFSGQMAVYGLPSGRLLRVIPVFSTDPEKGWGYSEETKPMLNTSHGFVPWDDAHHPEMSQTNGEVDGRWVFINGNNTPRIARIDLTTFRTAEIIEIPNSASPVRLHNRCKLTGRPRGYMRQFGLSRVTFREMANQGLIPGVKKASW